MANSNLSKLDSLGYDKINFEEVTSAAEKPVGDFIERIHNNLRASDSLVSGRIADIQIERTDDSISVTANGWLLYQDKGINGSEVKLYDTPYSFKTERPPIQPFKEWVKARNLQKRNNAKYGGKESSFKDLTEEEQINSAAYAIREKVFKEGVPPKNIYTNEIPKLIEDIQEVVGDVIQSKFLDNLTIEINL